MATLCAPRHHCNTYVPSWLSRDHLTAAQGAVNMKVCFGKGEYRCFFRQLISVTRIVAIPTCASL